MRWGLIIGLALCVAGCATDIMQGFIGKPVQEVSVRYGPPQSVFDMPDGRRAFQWEIREHTVVPGNTTTTTYRREDAYGRPGGKTTIERRTTPTRVIDKRCLYTMYGRWDEPADAWIMTGFEQPSLECL